MNKYVLLILSLLFTIYISGQNVAINTTGAVANTSSILDVSSNDKGILIPRVSLSATNLATPITSPATSLLVYNTATAGTSPNDVTPGYYYWNGTQWLRLADILNQNVTAISNTTEIQLLSNNTGTYSLAAGVGYTPGTWQDVPNTTITPTIIAGNKILVSFHARWELDTWNYYGSEMIWFRILRGTTEIGRTAVFTDGGVDGNGTFWFVSGNVALDVEDTGVTAGANTYKVQYWMTNYQASFTESFYIGERYTKVVQLKP